MGLGELASLVVLPADIAGVVARLPPYLLPPPCVIEVMGRVGLVGWYWQPEDRASLQRVYVPLVLEPFQQQGVPSLTGDDA